MTNKNFNNNGFEFVDLELPSGTLWATKNVGADKATDYGLYFQWGDIEGYKADEVGIERGYKKFGWSDYKFGKKLTKYTKPVDTLDLEDDAANEYMGGDWHIPTPDQILELLDNTTNTWTTKDGVNGRLFTSTKDTSKSIFIPAAGVAWNVSVQGSGDFGGVWSSMLYMDDVNNGQFIYFYSGSVDLDGYYRCYGLSVRGVIG